MVGILNDQEKRGNLFLKLKFVLLVYFHFNTEDDSENCILAKEFVTIVFLFVNRYLRDK